MKSQSFCESEPVDNADVNLETPTRAIGAAPAQMQIGQLRDREAAVQRFAAPIPTTRIHRELCLA